MTRKTNFPSGILLDVGCRDRKEKNFIGIDGRNLPGIDIVHDLEDFPYPLKDESCLTIKAAHIIEHIKPQKVFSFMDELWRLLIPDGQLAISAPYAGSMGFYGDPTHCTAITEMTWQHFDPNFPLYQIHKPKPWKIEHSAWRPGGNIEAIFRKRSAMDTMTMELTGKALTLGAIQKASELYSFLEFIKNKPLRTIVEIGTARGGVFYTLCQLAPPNATIVSVDMPGGKFGGGYSLVDEDRFKSYARNGQNLHFLREDSHDEITKQHLQKILKSGVNLLFIDGDHTYPGVKKDWQMYSPMVKKGGFIVFHDICHHPNFPECQVDRLWKELKRKYPAAIEFIDENDKTWGGIGIIAK